MSDTPQRILGEPNYGSMFANIFSFLSRPLSRDIEAADVVIMGVPYDLATSGRSGTRFGPSGIRQASINLSWEEERWPWRFNVFERLRVIDYGDVCFDTGASESMIASLQSHAERVIDGGKTLISLGGDHFVALPLLRSHKKKHGRLSLIHFDAHTDTEASDLKYNHGSMFYHAVKEGIIDPKRSIQIGIRTEYDQESHPFEVLDANYVSDARIDDILQAIRNRVKGGPAYISFDIDCLDPAYAPGTGTPVAGGMTTVQILKILRGLVGEHIVGMDLVEVAPAYDHADITSLAAATIVLEVLYVLAATAGN